MENKKMNLIEFMLEYRKNNSDKLEYHRNRLNNDLIKLIENELLQLIDFSNVKKINVIYGPTFISDTNGIPLDKSDTYVGGKVMFAETVTHKIEENDTNFLFNEEIDIYDIELIGPVYESYDLEKSEFGVWKNPAVYPMNGDKKYNSIVIKYDFTGDLYDYHKQFELDIKNKIKENILSKVEELLNDEALPNTPSKHMVKIRLSKRSIKK